MLGLVPAFAALFPSASRAAVAKAAAAGRDVTDDDRMNATTAAWQALKAAWMLHVLLVAVWIVSGRLALVIDVTLLGMSTAVVKDVLGELRFRRVHGDVESVLSLPS